MISGLNYTTEQTGHIETASAEIKVSVLPCNIHNHTLVKLRTEKFLY